MFDGDDCCRVSLFINYLSVPLLALARTLGLEESLKLKIHPSVRLDIGFQSQDIGQIKKKTSVSSALSAPHSVMSYDQMLYNWNLGYA